MKDSHSCLNKSLVCDITRSCVLTVLWYFCQSFSIKLSSKDHFMQNTWLYCEKISFYITFLVIGLCYFILYFMFRSHHRYGQECLVLSCRWHEQNWRQIKTVFSSHQPSRHFETGHYRHFLSQTVLTCRQFCSVPVSVVSIKHYFYLRHTVVLSCVQFCCISCTPYPRKKRPVAFIKSCISWSIFIVFASMEINYLT